MAKATPTPTAEQLKRRSSAIEQSGWGRPFHLVQPHNLAFWVWLVLTGYGAWQIFKYFSPYDSLAGEGILVGVLVAVGYGSLLWLFFRWVDRYDRLPLSLLLTAFVWGGLAAPYALALNGNPANIGLLGTLFSPEFASDWGAAISAPIVEESAKGIGFLLLFTLASNILHSPRAALVTGAFVGLGFQIFEDVLYSVNGVSQAFFADQSGTVLHTAVLRIATGLISHPAYAGIFAVGLLFLIGTPAVKRNVPRGILLILISMTIHGSWDGAAAIGANGPGAFLAMIASSLLAIFALVWAFRLSSPLEQQWMRDILDPEIAAGNVTAEEVEAAGGTRKTRRAFIKAAHGHHGRKQAKHAIEATIDLAHDLAVADGRETDQVAHARSELIRVRPGSPMAEPSAA